MNTRLAYTNIKEMAIEIPAIALSTSKEIENDSLIVNNHYAEASFQTIRTQLYAITDAKIHSHEDLKVFSRTEENNYIWFCAALQGNITSACTNNKEEKWQSGHSNLLTYNSVEGYTCFSKNKPFRMLEIMLDPTYIETILEEYPGMIDQILGRHTTNQFLKAANDPIPFCTQTAKAIKDLLDYKLLGNMAPLYLDAKIREILSLFLCRLEKNNCKTCSRNSTKDKDLLLHAKAIIEEKYLNPLPLRQLAHQVGTNECKLKKNFKAMFGTTVFGYLLNYRMEKACRYLDNTEKTVRQIAEDVGYEYHSHFATAFKRKFGLSPQEYRQNRKE